MTITPEFVRRNLPSRPSLSRFGRSSKRVEIPVETPVEDPVPVETTAKTQQQPEPEPIQSEPAPTPQENNTNQVEVKTPRPLVSTPLKHQLSFDKDTFAKTLADPNVDNPPLSARSAALATPRSARLSLRLQIAEASLGRSSSATTFSSSNTRAVLSGTCESPPPSDLEQPASTQFDRPRSQRGSLSKRKKEIEAMTQAALLRADLAALMRDAETNPSLRKREIPRAMKQLAELRVEGGPDPFLSARRHKPQYQIPLWDNETFE